MNGHRTRSWSAAELLPLILLGLAGLNLLYAAPAGLPSSSTVPQPPRLTPKQPPPANKVVPVPRDHRLLAHYRV